jgi:heme exporter protein A
VAEETKDARGGAMITVEGLTKTFGVHRALSGVDLAVQRGESVVIFGPNGAGKTTLIKILATIMNPTSGRIAVDGMNPRKDAEKIRRLMGVITHQTFLYGTLTAYENLEFYCRLYDVPDPKQRIRQVAEEVAMTPRLHDRVGTLSRGMQQRFSIARALLHRPSIMLLDEPETGLDQQAVAILREALRTEEGGRRTVILTTHNMERGLEMGDRLLILDRGRIAYQGSTGAMDIGGLREVYHRSTGVKA